MTWYKLLKDGKLVLNQHVKNQAGETECAVSIYDPQKQSQEILAKFSYKNQMLSNNMIVSRDSHYAFFSKRYDNKNVKKPAEIIKFDLKSKRMEVISTKWVSITGMDYDRINDSPVGLFWGKDRDEKSLSGQLWSYDWKTGDQQLVLDYDENAKLDIVIYPDNKHALIQDWSKNYWIYNLETGAKADFRDYYGLRGQIDRIDQIDFSPEAYRKFMKHVA